MNKTTKTKIILRQKDNTNEYYLVLQSYPVLRDGKKVKLREHLNRTVTTVIWNSDINGKLVPKRSKEGVILCRSTGDNEACRFAEQIRRMRQNEYDRLALMTDEEREIANQTKVTEHCFIDYMQYLTDKKHSNSSKSIKVNWERVIKLLKLKTNGSTLPLKDVTPNYLEELKEFFLTAPCGGNKKGYISRNTASTYFSIVKAALHQCFRDGYIKTNIAGMVSNIEKEDSCRDYLTRQELQLLADTPCADKILKRASLFSALTGIRHCDIMKLKWSEIIEDKENYRIRLKQKKTKNYIENVLSREARQLCGKRRDDEQLVFDGLTPPSWISRPLRAWLKKAGISKHITFHCFRHTFATLQLSEGTDLYTVSKLLGHTDIRTTQIYTKIIDEKKAKAAEAVSLDLTKI